MPGGGPIHQSCSADEQCGFPVAGWCRSKAGGSCCQPLAGMVVVNRRHADSLDQSGRRKAVRCSRCGGARGENLWPRRSASASGSAARRPAAADGCRAARAAARFWRGARYAGDLRLLAAGFCRWRRRHSGGRDAQPGRAAAAQCPGADRSPRPANSARRCNRALSIAPEQPTAAIEATGHLVVEPLPESPVHAEIEPTHQPDAAAMDRSIPDYEDPADISEAPAEFALVDEAVEPAAEPMAEHIVADESPAEIHDEEPSPFVEAVADEPAQPSEAEPSPALGTSPAVETTLRDELTAAAANHRTSAPPHSRAAMAGRAAAPAAASAALHVADGRRRPLPARLR